MQGDGCILSVHLNNIQTSVSHLFVSIFHYRSSPKIRQTFLIVRVCPLFDGLPETAGMDLSVFVDDFSDALGFFLGLE